MTGCQPVLKKGRADRSSSVYTQYHHYTDPAVSALFQKPQSGPEVRHVGLFVGTDAICHAAVCLPCIVPPVLHPLTAVCPIGCHLPGPSSLVPVSWSFEKPHAYVILGSSPVSATFSSLGYSARSIETASTIWDTSRSCIVDHPRAIGLGSQVASRPSQKHPRYILSQGTGLWTSVCRGNLQDNSGQILGLV
nr:hypothetical protein CFP56_21107 [Quercus suber]